MADSFRQFSFSLKLNDKKEAAWCQKELNRLSKVDDGEGGETSTDFDWTVFPVESLTKPQAEEAPHIWFRDSGGYGNVEQVTKFVEKYLKKFQSNGYFVITWADTCSSQRVGEFGGGIAVVKAGETHWFSEDQWVDELTKTLQSRNM